MKNKGFIKHLLAAFTVFSLVALAGIQAKAAVNITFSNGYSSAPVTDRSLTTTVDLSGGTKITISNASEVKHLYILWDYVTMGTDNSGVKWAKGGTIGISPWTLYIDGEAYTYGEKGFVEEYIKLPKQGSTLVIEIPQGGASVCEIYAIEEEEVPDYVHIWEDPVEEADILLISAHSDDEIIFFGGTMPYYANELGLKVQVAYFTYHEQKVRVHEKLNSLWYCGIHNYPILGQFKDINAQSGTTAQRLAYAETLFDDDAEMNYIVELLRRFKPNVVLTHDFNGEYGHGVHMLVAKLVSQAITIATDPLQYASTAEKYGVWDVPKTYIHLYKQNQIKMDWDFTMESYGGANCYDVIVKAFKMYSSQTPYYPDKINDLLNHNPKGQFDCRPFGLYKTSVGLDVEKNDFLENIKPIDYKGYKEKYEEVRSITHKKSKGE